MLERIDDRLWIAEGEIVDFFGFPYPTRSVVVRFDNGDLWVWSPVRLSPQLRAEVDGLGRVRHLVSPDKLHHLYLQDWRLAYPDVRLWGPRSTISKRGDLIFQEPLTDAAPAEWRRSDGRAFLKRSLDWLGPE